MASHTGAPAWRWSGEEARAPAPVSRVGRGRVRGRRRSVPGPQASRPPVAQRRRARGRSCSTRIRRPGGQIHRHLPGEPAPEAARPWLERLAVSGAILRNGASVFDVVAATAGFRVLAETADGAVVAVRARALVLATGARELFLPFPGWTLPGVMGAGGAQAMKKMGADFRGRRAVVAGSGPLLLPVAASLAAAGAEVALVAEQAGRASLLRFGAALLGGRGSSRRPPATAPASSPPRIAPEPGSRRPEDTSASSSVVLTDGRDRFRIDCDLAAVGYGLVPNVELARLARVRAPARRGRRRRGAGLEPRGRLRRGRALRGRRARGRDRRRADRGPVGRPRRLVRGGATPPFRRPGARPAARLRHGSRLPPAAGARLLRPRGHDRLPLRRRAALGARDLRGARARRSSRRAPGWARARAASARRRSSSSSAGIRIRYARPSNRPRSAVSRRWRSPHEMAGSVSGGHDAFPRGPLARPRLPGGPAGGDARGRLPRVRAARLARRVRDADLRREGRRARSLPPRPREPRAAGRGRRRPLDRRGRGDGPSRRGKGLRRPDGPSAVRLSDRRAGDGGAFFRGHRRDAASLHALQQSRSPTGPTSRRKSSGSSPGRTPTSRPSRSRAPTSAA